ncbi:MAG: DUF262 domain-containing protein [Eubacteriales bacterium]
MSGIVGTIIKIKDLYGKNEAKIYYGQGREKTELFGMKENRKFIIPLFQREIRWQKGNLMTLITDVEKGAKFLGNIILTETENGDYEILDGQQRTTIIYLLIQYIKFKHNERFAIPDVCGFQNESFLGLNKLFECNFDVLRFTEDEKQELYETDDYKQADRYKALWKEIENSNKFENVHDVQGFLTNLLKCEVNVIVNIDSSESGIMSFLDVNLKGVKLDTEDIFKGYLCSQDNSESVHDVWSRLKKIDAEINNGRKVIYPFMTILEHYFRCKLMLVDEYKDIEFNSEFELVKEQIVEGSSYSQSTHLIAVINNKDFLNKCLNEIQKIMEFIKNTKDSAGTSDEYAKIIKLYNSKVQDGKKIQDKEIDVMFNLIKKIILDSNKAPNCLLMRYLIDVLFSETKTKEDIKRVYAVSTAGLIFTLYASKKDTEVIKKMIGPGDWYEKMCKYVWDNIKNQSDSVKTVKVAYRQRDLDCPQNFRCKTLATIYDFYEIEEDSLSVKSGKLDMLEKFLNDKSLFSLEHFIVNDSGKIEYQTPKGIVIEYKYNHSITKYKDSLLNYIFITESLNNALRNEPLNIKCKKMLEDELKSEFEKEKSDFSKNAVRLAKENFDMPCLDDCKNNEDAKQLLDEYFNEKFEDNMFSYMKAMFVEMGR